jgi:RNase P subunit RPR2
MGKDKLENIRTIVNRRIDTLLAEAEGCIKEREKDSIRYIKLARKLAQRHRISLGERKQVFCSKCLKVFVPGYNCKVRVSREKKEIICTCGAKKTIFHKSQKKTKSP